MPKLTLKYELKIGKLTIAELNFREHTTAADYLAFDRRGGVAQRIALIASMTGTDETVIGKLHGHDYRRAEKIVDALMVADEAEEEGESTTPEESAQKK